MIPGIALTPLALALRAHEVMRDPGVSEQIEQLAARLDRPLAEVRKEAGEVLRGMVAVDARGFNKVFDEGLGPLYSGQCNIVGDTPALARLRKLNERHALVFLPSHRSYADPFVLGKLLRANGFPRNFVPGGDNMAFWPMGPISRRSGVIFIRRAGKSDEVYKAMLRAYFGYLVGRRQNLEWYMEGGRTRSGKLRPPMYGLMSYLVDAVVDRRAEDVILVPVSITYDRLNEVRAMATEDVKASKPREGLLWMARYMAAQRSTAGTVYVNFGEPLSLADALARDGADGKRDKLMVQKTAFEISQRINRVTPVTSPSLVTLALLGIGDRALTLVEIYDLVRPLLEYAHQRSLPTSQLEPLRHYHGVLDALDNLVEIGIVSRYDDGLEPVFRIEPGQHSVAAFYRNSAVHWFVNRAIVEMAISAGTQMDVSKETWRAAIDVTLAIRDLLKFEFFFSDKHSFRDELLAETELIGADWRKATADREGRKNYLAKAPFLVAHRVLPPFLEAYQIVATRLASKPTARLLDRKQLIDECMTVGHQQLLQQVVLNPECLSRELFGNALLLADNRGLLKPGGPELEQKRKDFARECADAVAAVAVIGKLDREHREAAQEARR